MLNGKVRMLNGKVRMLNGKVRMLNGKVRMLNGCSILLPIIFRLSFSLANKLPCC